MSVALILQSLFNVMKKEFSQTLRDRRMLATLIVSPVLQLVVFGYAIDLDVDRIPTVVCDQDRTPASRDLTQAFFADRTFLRRQDVLDPNQAQRALETGEASAALVVPRGFEPRVARADAPEVQVIVDGTDVTLAQVASNAASQFLLLHGIGGEPTGGERVPVAKGPFALPGFSGVAATASLVPRVMYNQRLKSAVYMLPGVLATLLLNVTAIVTAMGLARERETGTLEQILVTPIRPAVLLSGKCLPYILFGLIDVLAILLLGNLIFDVPFRGSLAVVALGSFLYLFSTLGIGILIATLSSSQQQAMLGAFAFMLPAMLLSGFMSPISSMPAWLRPFTLLIPMRHYIEIMRACLLKGAGLRDLAQQLVALTILGTGILGVSVMRFRKRLA
ncbi:MAG: ABC transporter permease [Polyangiaceae bacterium]|jgi:drug efflux transport system permease protein